MNAKQKLQRIIKEEIRKRIIKEDVDEIIDSIDEAISMVEEAKDIIEQAIRKTPAYSHYKSYGRYGFDQLLGDGNSRDRSLHDLKDQILDDDDD